MKKIIFILFLLTIPLFGQARQSIPDSIAAHRAELILRLLKTELGDSLMQALDRYIQPQLLDSMELASLFAWKDSVNNRIADSLVSRDAEIIAIDTKTKNISDSLAETYSLTKLDSIRIDNAEAKAVTDSTRIKVLEDSSSSYATDIATLKSSVSGIQVNTAKIDSINASNPLAITVRFPQSTTNYTMFRAPYDMEIINVYASISAGGGDDSVKVNIRSGATKGTATSELFYDGAWASSLTGANLTADIYDQYLDQDEWVWFYVYSVVNGGEIGVSEVSISMTVIEKQ